LHDRANFSRGLFIDSQRRLGYQKHHKERIVKRLMGWYVKIAEHYLRGDYRNIIDELIILLVSIGILSLLLNF